VQRSVGLDLMRRAVAIAEQQWPEMADAAMEVPLDYFVDEEFAAKERELFETSPLALVAANEIANPNDFIVRNAVGRSVLLTRDEDGVAHAFMNYCRHRGAEPVEGCGNARRFSCPYHAWVYDTKGQLVGMPLRDRHVGLDLSSYGLVELPSEERHGFVWVVLRRDHPIDVAAHLGELDDEIGGLGCDTMQYYCALAEKPLQANWKSVAEGLLEGLHVPYVHADTFNLNPQAVNVDLAFHDVIGPHVRWGLPMFGEDEAKRLRATPEDEWRPEDLSGVVVGQRALRVDLRRSDSGTGVERVIVPLWVAQSGERPASRHADARGDGSARGTGGPPGRAGLGGLRARALPRCAQP
jgi:choline monooxygenase